VNPVADSDPPSPAYYCAAQLPWLRPSAVKSGGDRVKSFDLVGKMQISSAFLRLLRKPNSPILLQRGIAGSPREAAALPGRFLPELGRFLGSGHFFCAVILRPEFVAGSLMGI